ncbi:MAG TPA: hypothetical protein DDX19_11485 [Rhodopirellula baltica]|nr:hypothetical protein [Rhodopirellula baltica]
MPARIFNFTITRTMKTRRGGGAVIAEDISRPHDSATSAPPFTPRFNPRNLQTHPSDHLATAR